MRAFVISVVGSL